MKPISTTTWIFYEIDQSVPPLYSDVHGVTLPETEDQESERWTH